MTRYEAIECILRRVDAQAVVVAANGFISRDACRACDRDLNFYMIGSMGLASSIGLGIALSEPETKVIVLDGDGNVLMGFGALPMIGAWKPRAFTHVVLDNNAYDSTGGQRTVSRAVDFCRTALALGYRAALSAQDHSELIDALQQTQVMPGPGLLHVKVNGDHEPSPRVADAAWENGRRFREVLHGGHRKTHGEGHPSSAARSSRKRRPPGGAKRDGNE